MPIIRRKNPAEEYTVKRLQKQEKNGKKTDIFRNSPVRCLGYADDIGAALVPILNASKNPAVRSIPGLAYIPASLYMAADVIDKYKKGEDGTGNKPSLKMGLREAAYQGAASVAAPVGVSVVLNKLVNKAFRALPSAKKTVAEKFPKMFNAISGSSIGRAVKNSKSGMPGKAVAALLSIVTLIGVMKPIDTGINKFFEKVVDPLIGTDKKTGEK